MLINITFIVTSIDSWSKSSSYRSKYLYELKLYDTGDK